MIRIFFLLIVIFTFSTTILGQTTDSLKSKIKHEASFDFGTFYTSVLSKNFYGCNIDFKYYPYEKIATGICFSMTEKKIADTFSYSIGQPLLNYYEFGWINQYDVVHKNIIRIGINLNNGIVISRLGDNSEKERYWTNYSYRYRAKEVATNYFYLFQPGLDISFRLFSNNHYPDFYLTTKAKYRFVFGDSKYGQLSDYSNYYFGLGLSIIGFTDEESKKK
jgi:hypothetical protein